MTVHDSIVTPLNDLPDADTRADAVRTQLTSDGFTIVDSTWLTSVQNGANGPNQIPGQTLRNLIAAEPPV